MPETRDQSQHRVTLEQLLAVKRAERPTREFWEDFDREFQRRRLATMVQVSPWYVRLGRGATRVARWAAPVAAAAASLAVFFHFSGPETAERPASETAQLADASSEPTYTLLEEQYISTASHASHAVLEPVSTERPSQLQYKVREIGVLASTPRQFVTAAAPHTLSVSDETSEAQVVRTLHAAPLWGTGAASAAVSF
jgi:hypothetical protein